MNLGLLKTSLQVYCTLFAKISPILVVVLIVLLFRTCEGKSEQSERYDDNLKALNGGLRTFKLENGQLAAEKELLTVTNKELKNQVWIQDDSIKALLKKVKDPVVVVKWKTRYEHDTIYIPFDVPVDHNFTRSFAKKDKWFSFSGALNQEGISINDITILNTQRLVVGYKKGKPLVSVTNSNPYIQTEEMEGQLINIPKRNWVFGVGGTWNIYEPPSAGFFFGYKIFEF